MFFKKLSLARLAFISFALLIIAGSSIPGKEIPSAFQFAPDKLIHCAEYFVFGYLLFNWLKLEFSGTKQHLIIIATILLGSMMGIIDENYQRLTPGRSPDIWDWVLDTIGVLLAIGLILLLNRMAENKKGSQV